MSRIVNVAIAQMESMLGDVEKNLKKAVSCIEKAATAKADIICFPELFATGYNLQILASKTVDLSLDYYPKITAFISEAAVANNMYVIAPMGKEASTKGVLYNSAVVFDRQGNEMGSFSKTHVWALEKSYFKEGNDYPIFNMDFGKVGIIVCYDAGFPEAMRTLCLKGAEMVFIPSAWRVEDEDMWDLNIPQRALENLLFTVGVNGVGMNGSLHLFGKSKLCNPRGTIVRELPIDSEAVEVITIDLDDVRRFRTEIPYLRDRKPHIYNTLVE
ncbi:nitrilase-related carbon-nitrogen hydrolase [Aminobacterium mobile]|uniref:nitrilase-related carbon-nitrogen hydrolase n=1 Tax=Aminobacterium mobile TaxID=81467 RepID=UPI00331624AC